MHPKYRGIVFSTICLLLILYLKSKNMLDYYNLICFSILIVLLLLSAFLSKYVDLRISNHFVLISFVVWVALIQLFSKFNILDSISIFELDKMINEEMIEKVDGVYTITKSYIYDEQDNKIHKFYNSLNFEKGNIVIKDNKISYKIPLENKCLVKEYDKEYIVLDEPCNNTQ